MQRKGKYQDSGVSYVSDGSYELDQICKHSNLVVNLKKKCCPTLAENRWNRDLAGHRDMFTRFFIEKIVYID